MTQKEPDKAKIESPREKGAPESPVSDERWPPKTTAPGSYRGGKMNCPKCGMRMICEYEPYPPSLPYWKRATLYSCPKCKEGWLRVDQTYGYALIDHCFGRDVIPNGLYRWRGSDTLPQLIKRKDELWEKRVGMNEERI